MTDDLEILAKKIQSSVDFGKMQRAIQMMKREKHMLFIEKRSNGIAAIVKSQTNPDLEYSAVLQDDGTYYCGTQNIRPCGGLRGTVCKHGILLTLAAVKQGLITPDEGAKWLKLTQGKKALYNKQDASTLFAKYQDAKAGKIEWRPVEILPEDLMAF